MVHDLLVIACCLAVPRLRLVVVEARLEHNHVLGGEHKVQEQLYLDALHDKLQLVFWRRADVVVEPHCRQTSLYGHYLCNKFVKAVRSQRQTLFTM